MDSQVPQENTGTFSPARLARFPGGTGRLVRLIRKELSEILRDRRTIITLLLMPLLLYPLLSVIFQQFLLASNLTTVGKKPLQIGFVSAADYRAFDALTGQVDLFGRLGRAVGTPATPGGMGPLLAAAGRLRASRMIYFAPDDPAGDYSTADLKKDLKQGNLDLAIRIRSDESLTLPLKQDVRVDVELHYEAKSARGRLAAAKVARRLAWANRRALASRLEVSNIEPKVALIETDRRPIVEKEPMQSVSLAAIVPLILILMTITGAVYPAIDLTAGERERGTLEILVATPVPRIGLLFAKYVSVVTVAVLTALINLLSMFFTLWVSGLGKLLFDDGGLTPWIVVQLFGLLLLFATFFSAVLLILTSFARSFKEAQAYLIPLMLMSMAPGLIGLLPGLQLNGLLSIVPLMNIVLLSRDLLEGSANAAVAAVVVVTTLFYAMAAIAVAARIFGAEGVLYNEQSSWSDLFRRPAKASDTPPLTTAMLCFALIFPCSFLLNGLIALAPEKLRLTFQLLGTALLFLGFPLISTAIRRLRLRTTFEWQPAPFAAFAGAVFLGLSLFPLVYELMIWLRSVGLTLMSEQLQERIGESVEGWRSTSPVLLVGVFASIGVIEEAFFRGYLFSAFRSASKNAVTTILATALLFGVFHFVSFFDRLIPSTLLGLVLGYVCWQTRSVLPGMLLHACYNSFLIVLLYLREGTAIRSTHLPTMWIMTAATGTIVGSLLIYLARRREPTEEELE